MLDYRLSQDDLERHYFAGMTSGEARTLLLDGEDYYTPEAWNALVQRAMDLGLTHDEIASLVHMAKVRRQVGDARKRRWSLPSVLLLSGLVFVGLWIGIQFGSGYMALFMFFWLGAFAWFLLTGRY